MRLTDNRTKRKIYIPPLTGAFCLTDDDMSLLATSIGTFNDMGYGGDLGGDSGNSGGFNDMGSGGDLGGDSGNSGGFNDMGGGGDLGGDSGNSGGFDDMGWGGDLGGTVIGN